MREQFSTTEVADGLQVPRARILRYLEQSCVITLDSDADSDVLSVSEELAERDPVLPQLTAAAVSASLQPAPRRILRRNRSRRQLRTTRGELLAERTQPHECVND